AGGSVPYARVGLLGGSGFDPERWSREVEGRVRRILVGPHSRRLGPHPQHSSTWNRQSGERVDLVDQPLHPFRTPINAPELVDELPVDPRVFGRAVPTTTRCRVTDVVA